MDILLNTLKKKRIKRGEKYNKMAASIHVVSFLDGVSLLTADKSHLIFRHYSYTEKNWRMTNERLHSTDFTQVVSFALHHVVNGGTGKIPCSLCRHRYNRRRYRIIRYCLDNESTSSICTDGPTICEKETVVMTNGDTLIDLDNYITTPIDHIWQYSQPGFSFTSLIVVKSANMLDYFETSTKGGVSRKAHCYIPLDYAPVINYVTLHWKPKQNGRGLLGCTPLFIISTSFNQLLIFEDGITSLCTQLNESVEDMSIIKVIRSPSC